MHPGARFQNETSCGKKRGGAGECSGGFIGIILKMSVRMVAIRGPTFSQSLLMP